MAEREHPARNVDEVIEVIAWLSIGVLIYVISTLLIISVQTPGQ
jgi:hypothetical protein